MNPFAVWMFCFSVYLIDTRPAPRREAPPRPLTAHKGRVTGRAGNVVKVEFRR